MVEYDDENFIIRTIGAKEGDSVQYNLPTTNELALLVVGDFSLDTFKRDIIIETHSRELKRISSLHPAYMALQYPLLFPFGERGFQVGVLYNGVNQANKPKHCHMTMQEYYCYQFHYRRNQPNPFYVMDCYQDKQRLMRTQLSMNLAFNILFKIKQNLEWKVFKEYLMLLVVAV